MNTSISIQTSADWEKIRQENLKVVVDPMVFRTADVFVRGIQGAAKNPNTPEPEKQWSAIRSNIGSLCAFFDALILEELLPMYDYAMTFPADLDTGKHNLVEACNRNELVLVSVTVGFDAYNEVKRAAVATLDKLRLFPPPPRRTFSVKCRHSTGNADPISGAMG
jgi:hypothetical protein